MHEESFFLFMIPALGDSIIDQPTADAQSE
jgi:hypothetical protein